MRFDSDRGPQRLYPVVGPGRRLEGIVTRFDLRQSIESTNGGRTPLDRIMRRDPKVAYPDEPLRVVVHRMAETGLTRFPVVERGESRRLVGMISLEDLLKARALNLDAEQRRERIMRVQIAFPFGLGRSRGTTPSD